MKQKIREAIAVEGRYDAHVVRAAVDATVVELGGFSILKNNAKRKMLATLAATQGLIVLTDSDSAGFLIRAKLKDALKTLCERERSIITMRYFKNRTQTEIANELGISQAQVSRLEKAALAKMKKCMV